MVSFIILEKNSNFLNLSKISLKDWMKSYRTTKWEPIENKLQRTGQVGLDYDAPPLTHS